MGHTDRRLALRVYRQDNDEKSQLVALVEGVMADSGRRADDHSSEPSEAKAA
jgi:hypothetical protein